MSNLIFSFTITYIMLLTTGTISFIEALRTKYPHVRHIMNLETCISIIAGYFYSIFNHKIENENKNKNINWNEITQLRYTDWSITTPLMLLVLCLVLSFNSKTKITIFYFIPILFFNYIMLYIGYLGETKQIIRINANIIGFITFFIVYGIIFTQYVLPKFNIDNYFIFSLYLFVWSLYGIVYMFDEINKNIITNYLDLISKCLIGIGLWCYYVKIINL
jgi:bacteriorhodopsin